MNFIGGKAARKYVGDTVKQYEPADPYYEHITDTKGRKKRVKRDVPPGLSKRDEKTLRKIRRRAHYLDKGISLCGFRVGWTFFIGIIPMVGDVTDAALNYTLVVKPARTLDLPDQLVAQMMFNNLVSAGVGFVPLVGDIALAAWKANWRNANLLENYLRERGAANLKAGGASGLSEIPNGTITEADAPTSAGVIAAAPSGQHHMVAPGSSTHGQGYGSLTESDAPLVDQSNQSKKKGWFSRSSKL